MPGMMGNMGYGQPAPGLFSGGGALPPQTSTEQPRLGPKESTFDFVGVSVCPRLRHKLLDAALPIEADPFDTICCKSLQPALSVVGHTPKEISGIKLSADWHCHDETCNSNKLTFLRRHAHAAAGPY